MKRILILVGPGHGHYLPVKKMLDSTSLVGLDIRFAAPVASKSPLAELIRADGFHFEPINTGQRRLAAKVLDRLIQKCLRALSHFAGGRLRGSDGLPPLSARFIF